MSLPFHSTAKIISANPKGWQQHTHTQSRSHSRFTGHICSRPCLLSLPFSYLQVQSVPATATATSTSEVAPTISTPADGEAAVPATEAQNGSAEKTTMEQIPGVGPSEVLSAAPRVLHTSACAPASILNTWTVRSAVLALSSRAKRCRPCLPAVLLCTTGHKDIDLVINMAECMRQGYLLWPSLILAQDNANSTSIN